MLRSQVYNQTISFTQYCFIIGLVIGIGTMMAMLKIVFMTKLKMGWMCYVNKNDYLDKLNYDIRAYLISKKI